MAPVSQKIGKKNSAILSTAISAGVQLLIGLFADKSVWIYIVLSAANGFGAAILGVVGVNLWLDAAEYQLFQTGVDTRPTAMSMANIPMKLGMVISGPITAMILNASGFFQDFAPDGSLLGADMTNPTMFVRIFGFFPAAFSLAICLIYLFGYKITDEKAAEYAAANQKAMMEKMAASGGN
jgi:Na+/melibiose symporter-like transporter